MFRKLIYAILILGILICLSPLLMLAWASNFANRHGCELHEGFVNPCIVNGSDWGGTLYSMMVSGWLMMFTLPFAAMLFMTLCIVAFGSFLVRCFRKRPPPSP